MHVLDGLLVAVEHLVHRLRERLALGRGERLLPEAEALEGGIGQFVAVVGVWL